MSLQAVVFDFDGTIFDTETVSFDAVRDVYAFHGRHLDPTWWSSMIGTTSDAADAALEALAEHAGLDATFLAIEVRARVRELLRTAKPMPGVRELVEECIEAAIPVAIATSAPRKWVSNHLTNLGLLDHFDAIVPVDEVANAKPHPEPYLTACRLVGADPRRCVAIEDSPPGVRSAVAAGLYTFAVAGHLTKNLDLSSAHCRLPTLGGVRLATFREAISVRA